MVTDSLDWVKENWEVSATTALGIGLLIGGIFFPPLLVLGASVLIGEAISGLVGYYWSGLRGKELTQDTAIGGILGLVSGGVLGVGTKLLGIGAKSILTLGGASGVITSVVDDLIRGKKIGLKKAIVWGTLSVALAGVPFVGQSIGKYINPAKPAVTASETQVGANVAKTSENSVASNLDKNELLRIMQTGEGNLYDLLKRAGIQPSFSSEDILAAKNVIMQYKPKDIMTGKIPTEGNSEITVEWTNHGYKHFPQKNMTWGEIVKSTKNGPAKYKNGIEIESIERQVWDAGIPVTNGKPWKVQEFDYTIGASNGKETSYMRVEESAGVIHGHPITKEEYKKLLK